jgi:hypothetical protein
MESGESVIWRVPDSNSEDLQAAKHTTLDAL